MQKPSSVLKTIHHFTIVFIFVLSIHSKALEVPQDTQLVLNLALPSSRPEFLKLYITSKISQSSLGQIFTISHLSIRLSDQALSSCLQYNDAVVWVTSDKITESQTGLFLQISKHEKFSWRPDVFLLSESKFHFFMMDVVFETVDETPKCNRKEGLIIQNFKVFVSL